MHEYHVSEFGFKLVAFWSSARQMGGRCRQNLVGRNAVYQGLIKREGTHKIGSW
jgi:hypothetical protein